MKKYNVVSGIMRSGTSLVMQILKAGDVPVLGQKYANKSPEKHKEAHPKGFWEVGKVTKDEGLTMKARNVGEGGEAIKVMMEVLPESEPDLINKAILIFREPRQVLTSILEHNNIRYEEEFILHLCFNIIDTFGWLTVNKIPRRIFFYDDLLADPKMHTKDIVRFFKGTNFKEALKMVDTKLNRSKPYEIESEAMDMWEKLYHTAKTNPDGILDLEEEIKNLGNKLIL